jgi:hypothetical protein
LWLLLALETPQGLFFMDGQKLLIISLSTNRLIRRLEVDHKKGDASDYDQDKAYAKDVAH